MKTAPAVQTLWYLLQCLQQIPGLAPIHQILVHSQERMLSVLLTLVKVEHWIFHSRWRTVKKKNMSCYYVLKLVGYFQTVAIVLFTYMRYSVIE